MAKITNMEVFRVGRWTDSSGHTRDWSIEDLRKMAGSYDPAAREAPLVVGHPKTNGPAYGWIVNPRVAGDRLVVDVKDAPEAIIQAIREGRYRKRSISVAPDGALRHVGLLGAAPPAVPGLKEIDLAAAEGDEVYEFALYPGESPQSLEDHMSVEAQLLQAQQQVKDLERRIAEFESGAREAEHSASLKAAEAKAVAAEEKAKKAEQDFAAYKTAEIAKSRTARVDALVKSGRILPADKPRVLAFAASLAQAGAEMDFASADGKTEKVGQDEVYLREFEARPANYTGLLDEVATSEHAAPQGGQVDDKPINYANKI
ncbi:MAG: hypothetical protein PWQ57_903 [Desulfovibrionales bacterium]|nr:hypothetical protein [Desulfovibrionales bacterium]